MIDIEAFKRRTAWLKFLQPGDAVRFVGSNGAPPRVAHVEAVDNNRLWVGWTLSDGTPVRSWVWRDTGDCPGARTRIDPDGPDVAAPDERAGGWEAA
jgi:hypothetical protein